jgi:DNA-binding SARP family transcriptional activator
MHYQLLGSVEVRGPLCSVAAIGKDAVFLAELLIHPGAVVSSTHLAQELWPDRPPRDPANAVQVRASRVRSLLRTAGGRAAGERLRTRHGGYSLESSGTTTDVRLYEDAVKLASKSLARGDHAAALTQYDRAREHWRGYPLPGICAGECLAAEIDRLLEVHLAAEESRAGAALGLGRPEEVVAALTPLLRLHPYRERAQELTIRALAQSGRAPEALIAYARLRSSLREDLGTEPGPALRALHTQLLRAEMEGIGEDRQEARTGARAVRPAQLPMPTPYFVGRDAAVARIRAALTDATSGSAHVAAVTGMAGVGKSALAAAAAQQLRPEFPDGQLYLNLHSATPGLPAVEVLRAAAALLRSLGVDSARIPQETDEATALLRSVLAPTRTLLLLDDARSAAQVRQLLPAGTGCGVLVTSRVSLASLDNALHIRLSPLEAEDGLSLMALASGRAPAEFDSAAGRRLIEQCGRLPLALRIVAARLATRAALSVEDLAALLAERRELLSFLEADELSVQNSFTTSYEALAHSDLAADRHAGTALARVGALDLPEYSAPLMARLMDADEQRAAAALDRLVEVALLEEPRLGRYAPHDLVREFARGLAGRPDERPESITAAGRAKKWFADLAEQAAPFLANGASQRARMRSRLPAGAPGPFTDRGSALAWNEQEMPNLLALVDRLGHVEAGDEDALLLRLPYHIRGTLAAGGRIQDLFATSEIALAAARRLGDAHTQARSLAGLAEAHFYSGRPGQALPLQREAAEILRRTGPDDDEQVAWDSVALLLAAMGRAEEAVELLEQRLIQARQCRDHYRESLLLSYLAHALTPTEPRRAIDCYLSSMEAGIRADSAVQQAAGNGNIGKVYLSLGEPAAALAYLDAALSAQEKGTWNVERDSRLCRSRALRALGRYDEAAEACGVLLGLVEARGDWYGQGLAHHEMGLLLAGMDEPAAALSRWRHAERALQGSESPLLAEVRTLIAQGVSTPGVPGALPTT